jgi:hypothetical protein
LKILDKLKKAEVKKKEEKKVQEYTVVSSAVLAEPSWLELLSKEQLQELFLDFPKSTAKL